MLRIIIEKDIIMLSKIMSFGEQLKLRRTSFSSYIDTGCKF